MPSSLTLSYMDVPSTVQPPSGWVLDDYPSYSLFLVSSAHYILLFIAWCAYGGRGGLLFHCARRCVNILRLFQSFYLLSSSWRLHRLSANLTTRDYIRVVMLTVFVMTLAIYIICQFAALLPLVTSQTRPRSDVLEPQPGITAGESRMFLALGVQDRYPAVLSASFHRLGFM